MGVPPAAPCRRAARRGPGSAGRTTPPRNAPALIQKEKAHPHRGHDIHIRMGGAHGDESVLAWRYHKTRHPSAGRTRQVCHVKEVPFPMYKVALCRSDRALYDPTLVWCGVMCVPALEALATAFLPLHTHTTDTSHQTHLTHQRYLSDTIRHTYVSIYKI